MSHDHWHGGAAWKKILAAEMAVKTTPVLEALFKLQKK